MRTAFVSVAIIFLLAGCDTASFDDGVRAAVRSQLKDPDSVKFKERFSYQNLSCIKYNSKNGFGGYAGMTWAILEKKENAWEVRDLSVSTCSDVELVQYASSEVASLADPAPPNKVYSADLQHRAEIDILNEFKKRKLIDESLIDPYKIPAGPCSLLFTELSSIARWRAITDREDLIPHSDQDYAEKLKKLDSIRCS